MGENSKKISWFSIYWILVILTSVFIVFAFPSFNEGSLIALASMGICAWVWIMVTIIIWIDRGIRVRKYEIETLKQADGRWILEVERNGDIGIANDISHNDGFKIRGRFSKGIHIFVSNRINDQIWKTWILNCVISREPIEGLERFKANIISFGAPLLDWKGKPESQGRKVYWITARPTDKGYKTFERRVPKPRMEKPEEKQNA